MAAFRAGMHTVIIPSDNKPDLNEIEPVVRDNLTFVPAEHMDLVMETALDMAHRNPPRFLAVEEPRPANGNVPPKPEENKRISIQ